MAEYQRFVSYIYSYAGGVKNKNVGFAKVEIRAGELHMNINLKGVYTDAPELFGIYMLIDRDESIRGKYRLMKVGECMVQNGMASYAGLFNAANIEGSEYKWSDISGIAVANENNRFYMMFSMWEDYDINPEVVEFAGKVRKNNNEKEIINNENVESGNVNINSVEKSNTAKETQRKIMENTESNKLQSSALGEADVNTKNTNQYNIKQPSQNTGEISVMESAVDDTTQQEAAKQDKDKGVKKQNEKLYEKLYSRADYIDAFDDDYFYDCIEVTPEMLLRLPLKDKDIVNNSFLIHGYYNFHHLLFGRVCDNENNTNYFIGVPGMYCNRERYMASMFGFNNFKKSHRSDYTNPYFGYWYQEI